MPGAGLGRALLKKKIIQSIMSGEEQMNGITDVRRIECRVQSGTAREITCECPISGGHGALVQEENPANLLFKVTQ